MSATSCWPSWRVRRVLAMLAIAHEHVDPEQLALEFECELDEVYDVLDEVAPMRPAGGFYVYSKARAH